MQEKKKTARSRRRSGRGREIVAEVGRTGRTVWLAGLGAAAAVGEGARSAFATLVEEGAAADRRTSRERPGRIGTRVRRASADARAAAHRGVTGALHGVGIPTYQDINTLIDRVEMLTRRVESLRNR